MECTETRKWKHFLGESGIPKDFQFFFLLFSAVSVVRLRPSLGSKKP
jgi:hypothetical protein